MSPHSLPAQRSIRALYGIGEEGIQEIRRPSMSGRGWGIRRINVRELKNLIERAVLLSTDTYLMLPEFGAEPASETLHDDMTLAELERQHILQTLGRTGGKIDGRGGAAERLGLHHNTLRSRMKKLGIVRNAGSAYVHKEA